MIALAVEGAIFSLWFFLFDLAVIVALFIFICVYEYVYSALPVAVTSSECNRSFRLCIYCYY